MLVPLMKKGMRNPGHIYIEKLTGGDRSESRQARQEAAAVPRLLDEEG